VSLPLVLVDPPAAPFWPLAATRPVAHLLAGTRTFAARWAARAGPVAALWSEATVASASPAEEGVSRAAWPPASDGYGIALSTWVPPRGWEFGAEPAELQASGVAVGWRVDREQARALAEASDSSDVRARLAGLGLAPREVGGRFLDSIWAVMSAVPELVAEDAADLEGGDTITGVDPFVLLGEPVMLKVMAGVSIGPFVVLDTRTGPVVLDEDVRIEPHTVLRGPLYVGRASTILGGVVSVSSIGPDSKIHGDLEQSIVQGYSNKAHEGFVGHSVLGEWVNLGAGTTTSDLKNTYGSVRVEGPEGTVETGLIKVGSFVGDHVKTGIGTLLTTGARIGVGSHVYGGGVAPRWLPDFSWHDGRRTTTVRWEAFHRTAELAMARRGRTMTEGDHVILADLHAAAGGAHRDRGA
jgi:UDP-N-acetylglucosamine diphosphorylase/glucosamine-1-phosphate N-acetyltransferase